MYIHTLKRKKSVNKNGIPNEAAEKVVRIKSTNRINLILLIFLNFEKKVMIFL